MAEVAGLEASERLKMAEAVALGTGTMDRKDSRKIISSLERAIDGEKKKIALSPMALAAMGISLEIVTKENKDA